MVCRNCGHRNPEDAHYCANCGSPLQDDTTISFNPIQLEEDVAEEAPLPQSELERGQALLVVQRGPNAGSPPDFTTVVITKAKTSGVTPGVMVKDATGQAYLVKFDGVN